MPELEYDAFLSHASNDKVQFVESLAQELRKLGLNIWYDKFALRVGNSLHDSIERGLARSRYGIVVLSPAFIKKKWTRKELNGLFAREVNEQNVILPIWHRLSHAKVLEALPMIADMVALKSSDGSLSVARALVKVIRPELLTVDSGLSAVISASKRLAEIVTGEHPGYEVRLTTGHSLQLNGNQAESEKIIASIYKDGLRADILIGDFSKLVNTPSFKVSFASGGLNKLKEFIETGRNQEMIPGDFKWHGTTLPLIPASDVMDGATLQLGSDISSLPEIDVRLEVDALDGVLHIPIMTMKAIRVGTREAELRVAHNAQPFVMSFVVTPGQSRGTGDLSLSASFQNHNFTRIGKSVEFINALSVGGKFRIYDLKTDRIIMESTLPAGTEWVPNGFCVLVQMVACIEAYFGTSIPFPSNILDEELDRVHYLHSLVSGDELGTNLELNASCVKDEYRSAQVETWNNGPFVSFIEITDRTKLTPLFGVELAVPRCGMYTEQVIPNDLDVVIKRIREAEDGSTISVTLHSLTPTYIRLVQDI